MSESQLSKVTPEDPRKSKTITTLSVSPIYAAPIPLLTRIRYYIQLHSFKSLISFITHVLLPLQNKRILPTLTKSYPSHSPLTHRIFIPKSYNAETDGPLPLYLNIHGGGMALGSPILDDKFCHPYCNKNNILVISLDYLKAPAHPFPAGRDSLIATIKEILADTSLPINRDKIAIGGFSAGGHFALSVSQDPALRPLIKGVVAYYPVVNFISSKDELMSWRATQSKNAPPDMLEHQMSMFNWGYMNTGQDLTDKRLSVQFAKRDDLPPKIFLVGCEWDVLCRDAEVMAKELAGREEGGDAWESNGIRWEKVLGEIHGFDKMAKMTKASGKRAQVLFKDTAEWLFREVYI
ncbi:hypothetical protein B7494_g2082 [Chlorociboria aeruginascens]|nr:hypothetical protein B7494_g2082 [Chlorociboria aeruginascens]